MALVGHRVVRIQQRANRTLILPSTPWLASVLVTCSFSSSSSGVGCIVALCVMRLGCYDDGQKRTGLPSH